MLLQPELGKTNEALLFGRSDRGRGAAKLGAAPLADLGDGDAAVFVQNQVDLAEARAIILRHDLHALLLQPTCHAFFGAVAARSCAAPALLALWWGRCF